MEAIADKISEENYNFIFTSENILNIAEVAGLSEATAGAIIKAGAFGSYSAFVSEICKYT